MNCRWLLESTRGTVTIRGRATGAISDDPRLSLLGENFTIRLHDIDPCGDVRAFDEARAILAGSCWRVDSASWVASDAIDAWHVLPYAGEIHSLHGIPDRVGCRDSDPMSLAECERGIRGVFGTTMRMGPWIVEGEPGAGNPASASLVLEP